VRFALDHRPPLDVAGLLAFLGARAVPGVETWDGVTYTRAVRLTHAPAVIALRPGDGHVEADLELGDPRDADEALARCRHLLDLDADPAAVAAVLADDPLLEPLVRATPGRRVPGVVDGAELAIRAVLGQQVSVAGARTLAGRLAAQLGEELPPPAEPALPAEWPLPAEPALPAAPTRLFPTSAALATLDPESLPMPRARGRALVGLATVLARGDISLELGADPHETRAQLLALPGIGPWTADYVAMRALGDRDAFLPTDLGVKRGLENLGADGSPAAATALAERWRPYRAYALQYLWSAA